MKTERHSPEVQKIVEVIRKRSKSQPKECCPDEQTILQEIDSWLDRWQSTAQNKQSLVYSEVTLTKAPERDVVLGDPSTRSRVRFVYLKTRLSLLEKLRPQLHLRDENVKWTSY